MEKWKKLLEISFYTNVPKATIIWVVVPEIQSETQNSLLFWAIFGPFTPLPPPPHDNLENQNFEKLKKASRDIIILHMCTKNDVMYSSWGVEFFLIFENFLPFCPPSPPNNPQNQILKKWKDCLKISSFYT